MQAFGGVVVGMVSFNAGVCLHPKMACSARQLEVEKKPVGLSGDVVLEAFVGGWWRASKMDAEGSSIVGEIRSSRGRR